MIKRHVNILVFVAGLVPLAWVLVVLEAREADNWFAVLCGAAYLWGLRRLGAFVAGRVNGRT